MSVCGMGLMRKDRVFGVCIRSRRVAVVTEMLLCYSLKTGKELFLRSSGCETAAGKISCNLRQSEQLRCSEKSAVVCWHCAASSLYGENTLQEICVLSMKLTYRLMCGSLDKRLIHHSTGCSK